MASILTSSSFCPKLFPGDFTSSLLSSVPFVVSITRHLKLRPSKFELKQRNRQGLFIKALTLDFSGLFFEGGVVSNAPPISSPSSSISVEDKEEPRCPPGLWQYETMVVLRPTMSEDERLALTQKYEEVTPYLVFSGSFCAIFWLKKEV